MIELMKDLPAGCLGVIGKGKITGEDYTSTLIPELENNLKDILKICYLPSCFSILSHSSRMKNLVTTYGSLY